MGSFGDNPPKEIRRVNVLGVRTTEETQVMYTYNHGMYSLLVEYTDGSRELKEARTREMAQYLPYISMV